MKLILKYLLILFFVIGCYESNQTSSILNSDLELPADGVDNNNRYIGPFCCTGVTATIEHIDGYPIAYVYFMAWDGQAYNVEDYSIYPNIILLVACIKDFQKGEGSYTRENLLFNACFEATILKQKKHYLYTFAFKGISLFQNYIAGVLVLNEAIRETGQSQEVRFLFLGSPEMDVAPEEKGKGLFPF